MYGCRNMSASSQAASVHSTARSVCTTSVPWQWSTPKPQSGQLLTPRWYQLALSEDGISSACRELASIGEGSCAEATGERWS
jgi:hypothetical protein